MYYLKRAYTSWILCITARACACLTVCPCVCKCKHGCQNMAFLWIENRVHWGWRCWWCRFPMTHGLLVFYSLEPKFTPSKVVLCVELTLYVDQWGVCLLSKTLYYASAWKSGKVSLLLDIGTTQPGWTSLAVTVPCWKLSYTPYVFRHCDLLVLTIIITTQCQEKKTGD